MNKSRKIPFKAAAALLALLILAAGTLTACTKIIYLPAPTENGTATDASPVDPDATGQNSVDNSTPRFKRNDCARRSVYA